MPKYKDSYTDEHFHALLEETTKEPILRLALRHPDVPYAMSVHGGLPAVVVNKVYSEMKSKPKNTWCLVSIRVGYRKHVINSVEVIEPFE